jgi:hypothetical protein
MPTVSIRRIHYGARPNALNRFRFLRLARGNSGRDWNIHWVVLMCSSRRCGNAARRGVSDGRFDGADLLPRPCRLKPQGLVRARGDASHGFPRSERIRGGNDRSRVALGLRSTADRLRVWIVPAAFHLVEGNDAAALRPARGVPRTGFAPGRSPLSCTSADNEHLCGLSEQQSCPIVRRRPLCLRCSPFDLAARPAASARARPRPSPPCRAGRGALGIIGL